MEYYTSEPIDEAITAIRSKTGEILYLIEGSKRTVLIDTCIGIVGLKEYVNKIRKTQTPLTVLLSHGHIDHAMGAPEFEECFLNSKDIPLYQSQCSIQERRGYASMGIGEEAWKLPESAFVPATPDYPFLPLAEGMVFDLGGISVEVYDAPGHTQGCMAFLIPEKEILITGDACNNSTFLFDDVCCSVSQYQTNIKALLEKTRGRYKRIFLMHHIIDAPVDLLEQMDALCDEIKNRTVDDVPFEFMGKHAAVAKKANERMERADGGFANLIYNPGRIQ